MHVINGYGLSETAAAVTIHERIIEGKDTSDKPGRPMPGSQIKIFNPDENGMGEICMRGRNVFMGYLCDKEATL